jgi:membrane protein DedA with SNARE-associated domain
VVPLVLPVEAIVESPWVYVLIVLTLAGSAVFPPLPSETLLAASTSLALSGRLHLAMACLATTVGSVLGDVLAFTVGRGVAGPLRRRLQRSQQREGTPRWREILGGSWGTGLVVAGRFVPGGTTAVGLAAGVTRFPLRRFLLGSVVGSVLWTGYGLLIGVLGHAVFPEHRGAGVALTVVLALVVGVVVQGLRGRRSRRRRLGEGGWPVAHGEEDSPRGRTVSSDGIEEQHVPGR